MKRFVVKIGSSSLVKGNGLNKINMRVLVEQISLLREKGAEVVLVTSGAIPAGMNKLGLKKKPVDVAKKQACAAIGQPSLIRSYEQLFEDFDISCAQVLLTHDDFGSRKRSDHLKKTMEALFSYGVVPIINENDAISDAEIKVGDNDTLSAMVALIVGAGELVLITDVEGLYDGNPKTEPDAKLIKIIEKIDDKLLSSAGGTSTAVGTGGMLTKLKAAQIATDAGLNMRIMSVSKLGELVSVYDGGNPGSLFLANEKKRTIKQSWLIYCATSEGKILVDDGAKSALLKRKSLLSCGVIGAEGDFSDGSVVSVCDKEGVCFAKGTSFFSSKELARLYESDKNRVVVHANNIARIGEK